MAFPPDASILVFPSPTVQALAAVCFLVQITLLSAIVKDRFRAIPTPSEFRSGSATLEMLASRLLLGLVFLSSWAFSATTFLIQYASGTTGHPTACDAAIIVCVVCYGLTKLLIYAFLSSRLLLVLAYEHKGDRRRVAVACLVIVLSLLVGVCLGLVGKVSSTDQTEICRIGLRSFVTIFVLAWDFAANVFLTGVFVWQILRGLKSASLRRLAARTLVACATSLIISATNLSLLTVYRRWLQPVCFLSCGIDVSLNALVLFLTTPSPTSSSTTNRGPYSTYGPSCNGDGGEGTIGVATREAVAGGMLNANGVGSGTGIGMGTTMVAGGKEGLASPTVRSPRASLEAGRKRQGQGQARTVKVSLVTALGGTDPSSRFDREKGLDGDEEDDISDGQVGLDGEGAKGVEEGEARERRPLERPR